MFTRSLRYGETALLREDTAKFKRGTVMVVTDKQIGENNKTTYTVAPLDAETMWPRHEDAETVNAEILVTSARIQNGNFMPIQEETAEWPEYSRR